MSKEANAVGELNTKLAVKAGHVAAGLGDLLWREVSALPARQFNRASEARAAVSETGRLAEAIQQLQDSEQILVSLAVSFQKRGL